MLGVTFDTGGPQTTQKVATKLRLARACTTMCAQRRLDSAVIAASVSTLTRASYTAQFTPWTVQDLPALDVPLNKLFRRLSGNMATFPTQLLYLPPSMGGLGLPRLSTYINTRKWCMAQRALTQDDNTAQAVHGLLDRAARYCGSPVAPGQPTGISPTTSTPAWGSSLGVLAGAPSPCSKKENSLPVRSSLSPPTSLRATANATFAPSNNADWSHWGISLTLPSGAPASGSHPTYKLRFSHFLRRTFHHTPLTTTLLHAQVSSGS